MIDLHTHTNYTDGTWSVKKLLEEAQNANLEVLSITDHDTVKPYFELENMEVSRFFKGKMIPGVELNAVYDGIKFELLVYDFDYKKLDNWIDKTYNKELDLKLEFETMLASCKKNHLKLGEIIYDKTKGWPVDFIFPEIKKWEENRKYFEEKEWNNIDAFFYASITNKNFPAFVDFSIHYPKIETVVEEVRKAGGKLFIAHVFRYHIKDILGFIEELKDKHYIDGVEVYHSSFSKEQSQILKEYCEKNGLLMCGGSDCHGDKKPERKIGIGFGNMCVNKEIMENW